MSNLALTLNGVPVDELCAFCGRHVESWQLSLVLNGTGAVVCGRCGAARASKLQRILDGAWDDLMQHWAANRRGWV